MILASQVAAAAASGVFVVCCVRMAEGDPAPSKNGPASERAQASSSAPASHTGTFGQAALALLAGLAANAAFVFAANYFDSLPQFVWQHLELVAMGVGAAVLVLGGAGWIRGFIRYLQDQATSESHEALGRQLELLKHASLVIVTVSGGLLTWGASQGRVQERLGQAKDAAIATGTAEAERRKAAELAARKEGRLQALLDIHARNASNGPTSSAKVRTSVRALETAKDLVVQDDHPDPIVANYIQRELKALAAQAQRSRKLPSSKR